MREFSLVIMLIAIIFAACRTEKNEELGQVQECGNGQHFNLQLGECRALAGHQFLLDKLGFERLSLENGITVPRVINGKTPFSVTFSYDVSRRTAFDVVLKKVEYGSMLGDNLSDWAKVYVEAGRGIATVRLFPREGQAIPAGGAANFLEGQWLNETGYAIELKGGDRFENDDADNLKDWRVAGIEVVPTTIDDPEGKVLILGELRIDGDVKSCGLLRGSLEVIKTDMDLVLTLGLKEPSRDWQTWGETVLTLAKGTEGVIPFSFAAVNASGSCPPPGDKVQLDPWRAEEGNYLLQLDINDTEGEKIKFDDYLYKGIRESLGVQVLASTGME